MKNNPVVTQRKPAQKRGLERVQQILDAAEILITEKGTEGITVRELSARSATSAGSFYHFFADTDAVLLMLKKRYDEKIDQLLKQITASCTPEEWQGKNAVGFIHDLFSPYVRFIIANRAYLHIALDGEFNYSESVFHTSLVSMMKIRQPSWPEDRIILESRFMHSTALGVIQQVFLRDTEMAYTFLPKVIRLLGWELEMIEKEP